jgi:hypothetical protein
MVSHRYTVLEDALNVSSGVTVVASPYTRYCWSTRPSGSSLCKERRLSESCKKHCEAGMVTMQEDAVQKALAGVTSLQEVISKVGFPDISTADALSLAA